MNTTATPPVMTQSSLVYASFISRLVAMLIDWIIIGCIQGIVVTPILAAMGLGIVSQIDSENGGLSDGAAVGVIGTIIAAIGSVILIVYAISVLYYAIMESSKAQASVGKMALGIKVTDLDGNRISFGKAFLRGIGKLISSSFMCIGYIMAAFTEKKQALHDLMASTLVVKK
ncbi:MAG TPA: RDD family protein [Chryseosolibacter sp.]